MTNEGREAQAKEQEVIQRKRKAEDDKLWEGMCHPSPEPSLLYTIRLIITDRNP